MKRLSIAVMSLTLALAPVASARAHHYAVIPAVKAAASGGSKVAQGSSTSAGWVAGFIAAVAILIVYHEVMGPPCAKKGLKNGYDSPTFWRPLCPKTNVAAFSK